MSGQFGISILGLKVSIPSLCLLGSVGSVAWWEGFKVAVSSLASMWGEMSAIRGNSSVCLAFSVSPFLPVGARNLS